MRLPQVLSAACFCGPLPAPEAWSGLWEKLSPRCIAGEGSRHGWHFRVKFHVRVLSSAAPAMCLAEVSAAAHDIFRGRASPPVEMQTLRLSKAEPLSHMCGIRVLNCNTTLHVISPLSLPPPREKQTTPAMLRSVSSTSLPSVSGHRLGAGLLPKCLLHPVRSPLLSSLGL